MITLLAVDLMSMKARCRRMYGSRTSATPPMKAGRRLLLAEIIGIGLPIVAGGGTRPELSQIQADPVFGCNGGTP